MGGLSLDPSVLQLLVVILCFLVSFCIGVIAYFLKDIRTNLKEKFSAADKRMDHIEKRFIDSLTTLPRTYLHRDDWMRDQNTIDKRMEDMSNTITEMNRNLVKFISDGGKKNG